MKRLSPLLRGAFVMSALSVATAGAQASTATATMAITATVLASCTISTSPLPFGNYSATAVSITTTVVATCTSGSPYNVGLDAGQGTGATVAARKMTQGSNTLTYSLYQDSGHANVWGATIGTNTETGTGNGAGQSLTVYGFIPASQFAAPGSYSDTVTATITY